MDQPAKKTSTLALVLSFPANFWYANLMEILERLAFFGVRAIAPLYLVASAGDNGLGLTYTQKGWIYSIWALIQCLVPMVSGGYTERYGYRKSLAVAFLVNIVGYLCMANSLPVTNFLGAHGYTGSGFWVFLFSACCVAFGTAVFKPPCHGTIAKTTDEKTSSMGWGVFYWVVNIGGALAPMAAAQLRGEIDWHYVFYAAAIVTALNFLPLFILYREPAKDGQKAEDEQRGPVGVFLHSIMTIFKDPRLVVFLLIFSCFWLMFMQLWDLLPNFIDEWVDTSDVAPFFGWFSEGWVQANGQVKPEMLINIDSIAIIALVLVVSWLIRKMNKVVAMIVGMLISLVGFVGAGYTMLGWLCCLAIFIFAIGEMMCSPTFSAYIGLIAPKDKKALYMGYSNIPFAIGWALGNLVGGYFYEHRGARAELAMKHLASDTQLVAQAARAVDWSDSLERLPGLLDISRGAAFALAQQELRLDAAATAERLRETFRYDRGQVENLALLHLALQPDMRDKVIAGYAGVVRKLAERLQDDSKRFVGEVKEAVGAEGKTANQADAPVESVAAEPATEPGAVTQVAAELPAAGDLIEDVDEIKRHTLAVQQLARGEITIAQAGLASIVHHLPTIVGKQRDEALGAVRDIENQDREPADRADDQEVIALLWDRHGGDPDVLNNLALEYCAQATERVSAALRGREFKYPANKIKERMQEIERWIGVNKSKAFDALSVALGHDATAVDAALARLDVPEASDEERVLVHLAMQGTHRYKAVRDMDWRHNKELLRTLIRDDEQAREIVLASIDRIGLLERAVTAIRALVGDRDEVGVVTDEGIDYSRLATKQDLIQKALSAKDWTRSPQQAAQLMAMNAHAARALAASDDKAARNVLWDSYRPYMVWVYLGVFGLGGTLGMIIFYFATRRKFAASTPNGAAA
jgi:MFS family permease